MKRSGILFLLAILISSCSLSPQQVGVKTDTVTPDMAVLWTPTSSPVPTRTPEPTITPSPIPSHTATIMPTPGDTATPTLLPGYDEVTFTGRDFMNGVDFQYQLLFDVDQWDMKGSTDQISGMLIHKIIQNCTLETLYFLPDGGNPTYTRERRSIGGNLFEIVIFTGGGHFLGGYSLLTDDGEYLETVKMMVSGKGEPAACINAAEQVILDSAASISLYK